MSISLWTRFNPGRAETSGAVKRPDTVTQLDGTLLVPRRVQSPEPATGTPSALSGLPRMPRLGPSFDVPAVAGCLSAATGLTPRLVQVSVGPAEVVTGETVARSSTLLSKTATVATMPVVAATKTTTSGMDMVVASAERLFWYPR
ncbi:hypothetical protein [Thiocapsa sp.]|uniref:hypothetical protein n=1 Tax=Thiocapsa sp. TaxID=2024551 RepID=UPI0025E5502B|nr:hypothetical protein [Thiocapsa sp.]